MRLIFVSQLCILLVLPFNAWKTHYQPGYDEPFDICQLQKSAQYLVFVDCKSQLLHINLTMEKKRLVSRQSCQNSFILVV